MNGSVPLSEGISSRYIPKGQSLLIFNYGTEIKLPNEIINSPIFIVPTIASSLIINQTKNINLFGVSFIGDGLYKLLNRPIHKVNQELPKELFQKCKSLYEVIDGLSFQKKCNQVESFLFNNINRDLENETFNQALQIIAKEKGSLKVNYLSELLNVSDRQIQRLFKTRLGLTPKDFIKITRVNNYLDFILKNSDSVDWMQLVVEFDYHDQPHLIKEIKAITKLSPQKLLKYKDTLFHLYNNN